MKKIRPPLLEKGDKIGVFSPARYVEAAEIQGALGWIGQMGYEALPGKHVFDRQNQFAGDDRKRASDLISLLEEPEVKCIWATRGGYGCIRLMPLLEKVNPAANPKWLVGYSDLTVLHSWLNGKHEIQSIHGPMLFSWDEDDESKESFKALGRLLAEGRLEYFFDTHPLNTSDYMKGEVCGGNLSLILSMRGTPVDIDVDGKILLIEDIDEYLYHIDRIMQNLKYSGWLKRVSGLLVGGMNGMNDNQVPFGRSAEQIISDTALECDLPVIFGHPSGHMKRNMPVIMGGEITLKASEGKMMARQ